MPKSNQQRRPAYSESTADSDSASAPLSQSSSAFTAQIQQALDQQVAKGAGVINSVAKSVKRAAGEFDTDTPQLAELVRGAAGRLEEFSRTLEQGSVTDMYEEAAQFTRQRPAVVFGAAALLGFFAFRVVRNSSSQPQYRRRELGDREDFHGS